MSARSSHAPKRLLALLDPARLPRAERILGPASRAWRVRTEADARERILVELSHQDARRVQDDPVLGSVRIRSEIEGMDALEPLSLGSGRRVKPSPLPPSSGDPLRANLHETLLHAIAAPRLDAPEALWIAAGLVPRFFTYLETAPPSFWDIFRIHESTGGIVVRGPVPARRELAAQGLALAVPLRGGESRSGHALYIEHGAVAPGLRDLLETEGDTLVRIDRGRIVSERIAPAVFAGELLRHASAAVEAFPWPGAGEPAGADLRSRDAAVKLFADLARSREEDRELRQVLEKAFGVSFGKLGAGEPETDRGRGKRGAGWLRRFLPRKSDETLLKELDAASRKRLADPAKRARIIAKQRDAIDRLLQGLSGKDWRKALPLAIPLRKPSRLESGSTWLHAGEPTMAPGAEFALELLLKLKLGGVFGVGPRIYGQLETLYRRAGEALILSRDYRRAAHVFSYLLGEHSRAAAILEQGGFHLEAATVYYHFANKPRRAAVALERGGLHDEAARAWMGLLLWSEAARAWKAAGDVAQERAAWRRVVLDLEKSRRLLEAADVLERELDEPDAARAVLERCAMACDPESIEALERCARAWVSAGEVERASGIFARARARYEWAASEGVSRPLLALLANLAIRAARWSADDPVRLAAGEDAARAAWVSAANAWARVRAGAPAGLRRELDARLLEAARAGSDPWLPLDAERWLVGFTVTESCPGDAIAIDEVRLSARASSLCVQGGAIFAGLEDGRISLLREDGSAELFETGASKPIVALASSRTDLYSATEEEIHHFAAFDRGPSRPLQIEHTLSRGVKSMVLFPGAGLLATNPESAHLLHAGHLSRLPFGYEQDFMSIVECCGNTSLAALLLLMDVPSSFDVRLFRRREARGGIHLHVVERIALPPGPWWRIGFLRPDSDDLVVVGNETLIVYPPRRDRSRVLDLQISSEDHRIPPARVLAAPGHDALLIAYGDGSLEHIALDSGRRAMLLDGPEVLDPLVGFACQGKTPGPTGAPWTAWLLHESGLLRGARAGDRTHT